MNECNYYQPLANFVVVANRYSELYYFENQLYRSQNDNQQRGKILWNALGERVWLLSGGQSRQTIYVSGQVGHDDKGNIVGKGNMEMQMRQAYANIKKVLAQYGATIDNIVDELLFVTDMDAAFAVRVKCKQEVFSDNPVW